MLFFGGIFEFVLFELEKMSPKSSKKFTFLVLLLLLFSVDLLLLLLLLFVYELFSDLFILLFPNSKPSIKLVFVFSVDFLFLFE